MTMDHDTEYLQLCIRLIEQKLNWRPAEEWRNYEFTELTEKILDSTSVNLSATTLKRVFGKLKYESLPSSATLNALAAYLGFESWMQFKSTNPLEQETVREKAWTDFVRTHSQKLKKGIWIGATTVFLAIVVFGFMALRKKSPDRIDENAVSFSCRSLSEGLPNTVVFNFDLKNFKSDNIIIQQSWDSTKTIRVKPGQTQATGMYYVPGYFRAKLIVDGTIVK